MDDYWQMRLNTAVGYTFGKQLEGRLSEFIYLWTYET